MCEAEDTRNYMYITPIHIPHRARIQWHALKIVPYRGQTHDGWSDVGSETTCRRQTPQLSDTGNLRTKKCSDAIPTSTHDGLALA